MPVLRTRASLLKEWRRVAGETTPGKRRAIVHDVPLRIASERTPVGEKHLAEAMVAWLRDAKSGEPWAIIDRALAARSDDTVYLAARALATLAALRPRRWNLILAAIDRSPPASREAALGSGFMPKHYAALLVHAAGDLDLSVRMQALNRACILNDRRVYPRARAAASKHAKSAEARQDVARLDALFEYGFHARQTTSAMYEFAVTIRGDARSRSIVSEDVPAMTVKKLTERNVAAAIRRVYENPRLEYPIDWDRHMKDDTPKAKGKSQKRIRG